MRLKGNFAMEVWNSGCAIENHMDTNAAYWDELLFDGQQIYGVATDDGHPMDQHCRGWVMVNAENNVPAILDALKNGRFYASTGPEIYDFRVEDGVAKIECSPVQSVECHQLADADARRGRRKAHAGGSKNPRGTKLHSRERDRCKRSSRVDESDFLLKLKGSLRCIQSEPF